MAIASLGKSCSAENVTIGQAGVGTQVTDCFVKLVAIGLVYVIMAILFGSLQVPLVIFFALPLAVIGAFVALAAIGHARGPAPAPGRPGRRSGRRLRAAGTWPS